MTHPDRTTLICTRGQNAWDGRDWDRKNIFSWDGTGTKFKTKFGTRPIPFISVRIIIFLFSMNESIVDYVALVEQHYQDEAFAKRLHVEELSEPAATSSNRPENQQFFRPQIPRPLPADDLDDSGLIDLTGVEGVYNFSFLTNVFYQNFTFWRK